MTKLSAESKLFTFEHTYAQKSIIKLHQYLVKVKSYLETCTLYNLEINPKINFEKEKNIPIRVISIKSITDEYTEEEKFIYCFGPVDKEMAEKKEHGLSEEDVHKAFMTSTQVFYGHLFAPRKTVKDLLLQAMTLKQKIRVSSEKSAAVKERDFKYHQQELVVLLECFGKIFADKADPYAQKAKKKHVFEDEVDMVDVFGSSINFLPETSEKTIDIIIDIFNNKGVWVENNDMLIVFRNFHQLRYS